MFRHTARLLAVAAMATSIATLATNTALADPPLGGLPAVQDVVGVGADTDQYLLDQFSADYNAYLGSNGGNASPHLYSWDSTGFPSITPKTGATKITRPSGSNDGISALNSSTSAALDFARSSRPPQTGDPANDDFVAFAKDLVSWAGNGTGNAPASLSTTDLRNIYSCSVTNWNQITDVHGYVGPSALIKPYLPPTTSGTRTVFLQSLNQSVSTPLVPGACVQTATENEGTDPVFADPNAITPYSVGHYIGQVYNGHFSSLDAPGPLTVRSIYGISPITAAHTLNTPYFPVLYQHLLYNVVRNTDWTDPRAGATLKAIFAPNGWICASTFARLDTTNYGFQPLQPNQCGTLTHPPLP